MPVLVPAVVEGTAQGALPFGEKGSYTQANIDSLSVEQIGSKDSRDGPIQKKTDVSWTHKINLYGAEA